MWVLIWRILRCLKSKLRNLACAFRPVMSDKAQGREGNDEGAGAAPPTKLPVEDVVTTPCCSVCLGSLAKVERELPCNHQFHAECLAPWLQKNNSCPCCRAQICDPSRSTAAGGCIQASCFTADQDLQIRASGFTSGAGSQIRASGFTAGANTAILASGFTSNVADQSSAFTHLAPGRKQRSWHRA